MITIFWIRRWASQIVRKGFCSGLFTLTKHDNDDDRDKKFCIYTEEV